MSTTKKKRPGPAPHTRTPLRQAAVEARLLKAAELAEQAQHTLEAACRELCPIVGAVPLFRRASVLSEQARRLWDLLYHADASRYGLDHEPKTLTEPETA